MGLGTRCRPMTPMSTTIAPTERSAFAVMVCQKIARIVSTSPFAWAMSRVEPSEKPQSMTRNR